MSSPIKPCASDQDRVPWGLVRPCPLSSIMFKLVSGKHNETACTSNINFTASISEYRSRARYLFCTANSTTGHPRRVNNSFGTSSSLTRTVFTVRLTLELWFFPGSTLGDPLFFQSHNGPESLPTQTGRAPYRAPQVSSPSFTHFVCCSCYFSAAQQLNLVCMLAHIQAGNRCSLLVLCASFHSRWQM